MTNFKAWLIGAQGGMAPRAPGIPADLDRLTDLLRQAGVSDADIVQVADDNKSVTGALIRQVLRGDVRQHHGARLVWIGGHVVPDEDLPSQTRFITDDYEGGHLPMPAIWSLLEKAASEAPLIAIIDTCHAAVPPGLKNKTPANLIVLTACLGNQQARGDENGGRFTQAFAEAIEAGHVSAHAAYGAIAQILGNAQRMDHYWSSSMANALLIPGTTSTVLPLPPPTADVLTTYLEWLPQAHANLMPLFGSDALIDELYVELMVDAESLGRDRPADFHSGTLRDLMSRGTGRWTVLGAPGAGKSTLARYLVRQLALERLASGQGPIPVYVSLPQMGREKSHPFDLVEEALIEARQKRRGIGLADALRAHLGDVWLLLDGLDEVVGAHLKRVRKRIKTYASALAEVPIVVLSRPIGYERLTGFTSTRVQALDTDQQQTLLQRWLVDPMQAADAWRQIEASPTLSEIAIYPLLLTLIAVVFREQGEIPPTRLAVYQSAIVVLLGKGHCPTDPKPMPAPNAARRVLRQLSLYLQRAGEESWPMDEIARALRHLEGGAVGTDEPMWLALHALDDVAADRAEVEPESRETFLNVLAANSGIIGPHDGTNTNWRYLHRALRDALCAELLATRPSEQLLALAQLLENDRRGRSVGRWAETFGLTCAAVADPLALLIALQSPAPRLVRRALAEVDGLDPAAALALLLDAPGWDGEDLLRLTRRWPRHTHNLLWANVGPDTPLEVAAQLHYVLDALDALSEHDFFARIGRPRRANVALPEWVELEAATAWIGSPEGQGYPSEYPRHPIALGAYTLSRTTVTIEQFRQFASKHGCPGGPTHPATGVSWYVARLFACWAGAHLPTEAQWEHACRAGTATPWSCAKDDLATHAWLDPTGEAQPVGTKASNPWGLHDMHGNIWEWCQDWFGPYPKTNPSGPRRGAERVMRGGSAWVTADDCRSAYRYRASPSRRSRSIGFRLARPASPPSSVLDH